MLDPVTGSRNVAAPGNTPQGLPDLLLLERARAHDAHASRRRRIASRSACIASHAGCSARRGRSMHSARTERRVAGVLARLCAGSS